MLSDADDDRQSVPPRPHAIQLGRVGIGLLPFPDRQNLVLSNLDRVQKLYGKVTMAEPYWVTGLSSNLSCLEKVIIEGFRLSEDENYITVHHDAQIFSSCPHLNNLVLRSVALLWGIWQPPTTLRSLTIQYSRLSLPSCPPSAPDHDPGPVCPSLEDIARITTSITNLTTLSLTGCFEHTRPYVGAVASPGTIYLPCLESVELGGDGASLDALCRALITPNLISFRIATIQWTSLPSLHLLTSQLNIKDTDVQFVPFISAGDRDGSRADSVSVDFVETTASLTTSVLEALGSPAEWGSMLQSAAFPCVETVIIQDLCSSYSPRVPPRSAPGDWNKVMRTYPSVEVLVLSDGAEWALSILDELDVYGHDIWPSLCLVAFHLSTPIHYNEKIAFGEWQRRLRIIDRDIVTTLNTRPLTKRLVTDFIIDLDPDAVRAHFAWLDDIPF